MCLHTSALFAPRNISVQSISYRPHSEPRRLQASTLLTQTREDLVLVVDRTRPCLTVPEWRNVVLFTVLVVDDVARLHNRGKRPSRETCHGVTEGRDVVGTRRSNVDRRGEASSGCMESTRIGQWSKPLAPELVSSFFPKIAPLSR